MTLHRFGAVSVSVVLLAGCGHDFEPPDAAERIAEAAERYAVTLFDSVSWPNADVRLAEGNGVFAEKCRRCHGPLGRGGTDYALERGLEVPSLVEPAWVLASLDSLRRTVYVGHEEGMPGYGIGGMSPREIDASAFYVLYQLRPDVMRGQGR
jgi:mono/diheme cytochrome c family protein